MFDSLSERMKQDDLRETSSTESYLVWVAVLVLSVVLFGGLYLGIRMLE